MFQLVGFSDYMKCKEFERSKFCLFVFLKVILKSKSP